PAHQMPHRSARETARTPAHPGRLLLPVRTSSATSARGLQTISAHFRNSHPCDEDQSPGTPNLERETGLEPATNSLEGCDSTTELLPPENSGQWPVTSDQFERLPAPVHFALPSVHSYFWS